MSFQYGRDDVPAPKPPIDPAIEQSILKEIGINKKSLAEVPPTNQTMNQPQTFPDFKQILAQMGFNQVDKTNQSPLNGRGPGLSKSYKS